MNDLNVLNYIKYKRNFSPKLAQTQISSVIKNDTHENN